MRLLGNILWFILGGWWNFLLYALCGVIFCITIIGIPVGKSLFQYAKLMAFPFGKVIMKETEIKGKENVAGVRRVGGVIANILWLPFGIVTFISNIGAMLVCFVSIILIPVGIVLAKSCMFLLWPVGAKVVTKEEADRIRMTRAMTNAMGNVAPVMTATPVQATPVQAVPVQQTVPAQISQTQGKVQTAGSPVFENLKETGEKAVTMEEVMVQLKAKLYHNPFMAWVMSFLEYIVAFITVVIVIVGIVRYRHIMIGYGYAHGYIIKGILYGMTSASLFFVIAAVLGMIKRNHIYVLVVLGTELLAYILTACLGGGFAFWPIICYVGIIVWYVLVMMRKPKSVQVNIQQTIQPAGRKFCSQCGEQCIPNVNFCAKCGNQLK